ncbi:MAG: DsbA family protein [Pyrinomonadaceae bacterium]
MRDKVNRLLLGVVTLLFLGVFAFGQGAGGVGLGRRGDRIPADAFKGAEPPTRAGSPDATVQLEGFTDFSCPQCAVKNPIFNEIRAVYGNRISWVFRHFPLDIQGHEKSYDAAVAAEAAGFQGKFWQMQDLLLINQRTWTASPNYKEIWKGYARRLRLDVKKWEDDCAGMPARMRVDADKKRAKDIGVNSVPSLYLNNVEIPFVKFTLEDLKAAIDAELGRSRPVKSEK